MTPGAIMRVVAGVCVAAWVSACAPAMTDMEREVAARDVPTAMFVFFEKDTTELVAGSEDVIDRAATVLSVYDNIGVRVVGHIASDERRDLDGTPLDEARAMLLMEDLAERDAAAKVLSTLAQGTAESMAEAADGDAAVDRRVELIFAPLPG